MPKKGKVAVPLVNRRALSRREREERYRRWLYVGLGAIAALVVGVLAFGYYQVAIAGPAAPVATVDGTPIRTSTWQRYVQLQRYNLNRYIAQLDSEIAQLDPKDQSTQAILSYFQQQRDQMASQLQTAPSGALDALIDDQLIRKEAVRRNLTVSPADVQKEIEQGFGYGLPTPTPQPTPVTSTQQITGTPTPTVAPMTEQQFKDTLSSSMQGLQKYTGMSEADYRVVVESDLLRRKLQDALAAEVPTSTEQIHARQIVLATEDEAKAALDRINKGEDWAAVAKEVSQDSATKDNGGDLGWFPRGQWGDEFDQAAFALQPGQTSGPTKVGEQYYIIRVDERDANRPLEQALLDRKRSQALSDWLTGQRLSGKVKRLSIEGKAPKAIAPSQ